MPDNDVTFLAFGQDHRNAQWITDLTEQIRKLHAAGVPITLCNEHGPNATLDDELHIATERAATIPYFDACHQNQTTPSLDEFRKHVGGVISDARLPVIFEELNQHYQAGWQNTEYAGRGETYKAEVAFFKLAKEMGLELKGLDHPDKEALYKQDVDGSEFLRTDYMADRALDAVEDRALKGGGVVLAFNMGANHIGSLQTSLDEKIAKIKPEDFAGANVTADWAVAVGDGHGLLDNPQQARKLMLEGIERIENYAKPRTRTGPSRWEDARAQKAREAQAALEQKIATLKTSIAQMPEGEFSLDKPTPTVASISHLQELTRTSDADIRNYEKLEALLTRYNAVAKLAWLKGEKKKDQRNHPESTSLPDSVDLSKQGFSGMKGDRVSSTYEGLMSDKGGLQTELKAAERELLILKRDRVQEAKFAQSASAKVQAMPESTFCERDPVKGYQPALEQKFDPLIQKHAVTVKQPTPELTDLPGQESQSPPTPHLSTRDALTKLNRTSSEAHLPHQKPGGNTVAAQLEDSQEAEQEGEQQDLGKGVAHDLTADYLGPNPTKQLPPLPKVPTARQGQPGKGVNKVRDSIKASNQGEAEQVEHAHKIH